MLLETRHVKAALSAMAIKIDTASRFRRRKCGRFLRHASKCRLGPRTWSNLRGCCAAQGWRGKPR